MRAAADLSNATTADEVAAARDAAVEEARTIVRLKTGFQTACVAGFGVLFLFIAWRVAERATGALAKEAQQRTLSSTTSKIDEVSATASAE